MKKDCSLELKQKGGGSIAILGSAGRLGSALADRFAADWKVHELTRSRIDLGKPEQVRANLGGLDVDVVILAAAMTSVDDCEKNRGEAFAVNAEGPREVAAICTEKAARLVYVSTDFVFDGEKEGAYAEDDPAHPINVYGASKRKGEEYVLEASAENLVVRISWLYGPGKPAFPEWIIQEAMRKSELALPAEKTGTPSYAGDVAEHLHLLLGLEDVMPVGGIFHLTNSGQCTWQEWGQFCLDAAADAGLPLKTRRISANRLDDIAAFVAKRPVNSVLDTGKFARMAGVSPRPWQEAMRDHFSRTLKKLSLPAFDV